MARRGKRKPDLQQWLLSKGIKFSYDKFGVPIISDYVKQQYISEVHGFYQDPNTKQWMTPDGRPAQSSEIASAMSWGRAVAAGTVATLGTLAMSLIDGDLSGRDIMNVGFQGGKAWANSGISDWIDRTWQVAPGQGMKWGGVGANAALGSVMGAGSALLNGGNVLEGAVVGGVQQAVSSAVSQAATRAGLSAGAGAVTGGIASGVLSLSYELIKTGEISDSSMFSSTGSVIGAGIGSVVPGLGTMIGAAIGGILGSVFGAITPSGNKPKIYQAYRYERGNGVIWDEKSGKFVPQKASDFMLTIDKIKQEVSPEKKAKLVAEATRQNIRLANELNKKYSNINYSKLSAEEAYNFDKIKSRYTENVMPQSEDEWKNKYKEFLKDSKNLETTFEEYKNIYSSKDKWEWSAGYKATAEDFITQKFGRPSITPPSTNPQDKTPWGYKDEEWSMDVYNDATAKSNRNKEQQYYDMYKGKDRSTLPKETQDYLNKLESEKRVETFKPISDSASERHANAQFQLKDVMSGKGLNSTSTSGSRTGSTESTDTPYKYINTKEDNEIENKLKGISALGANYYSAG